jgi:hypothetical protein
MSAVATTVLEPLDNSSLEAIMIRWKLAEQHLMEHADIVGAGKMALHVLVSRDLPMLLKELLRLRPDLGLRP